MDLPKADEMPESEPRQNQSIESEDSPNHRVAPREGRVEHLPKCNRKKKHKVLFVIVHFDAEGVNSQQEGYSK